MENDILVAAEAASIIRVSIPRLYELSRTEQIPTILIGQRQYRYSKQALEKWLENGGSKKKDESDEN
jgi:excisionase family DNA binding protein